MFRNRKIRISQEYRLSVSIRLAETCLYLINSPSKTLKRMQGTEIFEDTSSKYDIMVQATEA
jgi:hypothetical protein